MEMTNSTNQGNLADQLAKPKDMREFETALEKLNEIQQEKLKEWDPFFQIIEAQNLTVLKFLKNRGKLSEVLFAKDDNTIHYEISATFRGNLKTVSSQQRWDHPQKVLTYLWQRDFVDQIQFSMDPVQKVTNIEGVPHKYMLYSQPSGYFTPNSRSILRAVEFQRPCDLGFNTSTGYPLEAVKYYKELIEKLLKRSDAKVVTK